MNIDDLKHKATQNHNQAVMSELLDWFQHKIHPYTQELGELNADLLRNSALFFKGGISTDVEFKQNEHQINKRIFDKLDELEEILAEITPDQGKSAEEDHFEEQLQIVLRQKNYHLHEKLSKKDQIVAVYRVLKNQQEERAVKVILSKDFNKSEAKDEMRLLSSDRTKNDNIVQVYEANIDKYPYFIITEYAKGRSLREMLRVFDGMPYYMTLDIMIGICNGCGYLRKKGIRAANFNPGHILMNADLMPLISPFKVFRTEQPAFLLEHFVEYAKYQSPERLCQEPDLLSPDLLEKADMFSIALIGYELLTGKVLFDGHDIFEVISKRWKFFNAKPEERQAHLDDMKGHPELVELLLKMLSPLPSERPDSLEDVITHLSRFKPALSTEQRIALKSYKRCLESTQGDFIEQFYIKFFKEFNALENIFSNKAMQQQKLKSAVKLFLECSSEDVFIQKLPRMDGHQKLSLKLADYQRFVELFVENLSEFDELWSIQPEIKMAWEAMQNQFNVALGEII